MKIKSLTISLCSLIILGITSASSMDKKETSPTDSLSKLQLEENRLNAERREHQRIEQYKLDLVKNNRYNPKDRNHIKDDS